MTLLDEQNISLILDILLAILKTWRSYNCIMVLHMLNIQGNKQNMSLYIIYQ